LATSRGEFEVHFFRDLANERVAMAIVLGPLEGAEPLTVRVHSSCLTSECLMGRDCDCAEQLEGALAAIAAAGRGIVLYLIQEGRGAGLTAKARDRMIVQASGNQKTTFEAYAEMGLPADLRQYGEIAPICALLGVRGPLCLLTNNPDKAAAVAKVLASEGIPLAATRPIQGPTSPFNSDYLGAKYDLGHALDRPDGALGALPPERVQVFEPAILPGATALVLMASYLLPVGLPGSSGAAGAEVEWFRSNVVLDRETGRVSIVLAKGAAGAGERPEVSWAGPRITMSLFDRLPATHAPGRAALVEALIGLRERGRGSVVVTCDEQPRLGDDDVAA
jgi:GTP cyclohydrolase II